MPEVAELRKLMQRAQRGDKTALPALEGLFRNPEFIELVGGNLARNAQAALIGAYCGNDLLAKEGLTRNMEALRAELTGATSTPLERLLVERVVTCWLQLSHLEAIYYGQKSMSLPLAMHYQRCITLAHKRYLSAIKMLAQVRKVMGLAFDVPRAGGATAPPATLPLVRRAANGPAAENDDC